MGTTPSRPPSPDRPIAIDGVRPRHARCVRCHYEFNGIPISQGVITCPECGEPSPFAPVPVRRQAGRTVFGAIVRLGLGVLLAVAVVMLLIRVR